MPVEVDALQEPFLRETEGLLLEEELARGGAQPALGMDRPTLDPGADDAKHLGGRGIRMRRERQALDLTRGPAREGASARHAHGDAAQGPKRLAPDGVVVRVKELLAYSLPPRERCEAALELGAGIQAQRGAQGREPAGPVRIERPESLLCFR